MVKKLEDSVYVEKIADRPIENKLLGVPVDLNALRVERALPLVAGCWLTCGDYVLTVSEPELPDLDPEDLRKKLPGGRWNCRDWEQDAKSILDIARLTVKRETYQETGLILPLDRFEFVLSEIRLLGRHGSGVHEYFLFKASVTSAEAETRFPSRAVNGEIVHYDPLAVILEPNVFLGMHRRLLMGAGLWPEKKLVAA